MTITYKDKFALLPTRCSKCNKLFIWEWYYVHKTPVYFDCLATKNYCQECEKQREG